ncbi:MAG TPA: AraC family transcriptional regulator [Verrucomicrobiae bacterium]|nr:AraC family transcriptional regulator [Verrucomicrobiae bacterium]
MENIKLLTSANSPVTRLDWKTPGHESQEGKLEGTFWNSNDGRLCVQHYRRQQDVFYQSHTHSEYTIMVCLAGKLTKTETDGTAIAGPGGVLMSNAGVKQAIGFLGSHAGENETLCLSFDRKMLATLTREFQLPEVSAESLPAFMGNLENKTVLVWAQDMVRELQNRTAGHQMLIEIMAMLLLVEIIRSWPRDRVVKTVADGVPRLAQRDFIRAYEFMRRSRKGTFRLQHLCSFLGMSKERFTRLFLASTETTPASFYNRMLLEQGRGLLRDRALSIKEISFQLGYKTTSHFIVSFRREFAASPQEYRHRGQLDGQVVLSDYRN